MREVQAATALKILSVTCDCCNVRLENDSINEQMEIDETLHFSHISGYNSKIFEDGTDWSIDLCQNCTKKLLGKYIKVHGNYISQTGSYAAEEMVFDEP